MYQSNLYMTQHTRRGEDRKKKKEILASAISFTSSNLCCSNTVGVVAFGPDADMVGNDVPHEVL